MNRQPINYSYNIRIGATYIYYCMRIFRSWPRVYTYDYNVCFIGTTTAKKKKGETKNSSEYMLCR